MPAKPDNQHPTKLAFFATSSDEALRALGSTKSGLSSSEAQKRLTRYGQNIIEDHSGTSPWTIIKNQFTNFLVLLLFVAAMLSLVIGEVVDSIAILLIIILNSILGFVQEYKAEKAMEALRKFSTLQAKVIRDGKVTTIDTNLVVPGDILVLAEGDRVAADARLIETFSLQTDESALTGESQPISKKTGKLDQNAALSDRFNLVFSGTAITRGKATAMVFATGMDSEFGQIATLVQQSQQSQTPLQKTMEKLGHVLGIVSIVIAIPGFIIGVGFGRDLFEMFILAISLMVSAIPEGLPIVVTITLAMGARRLVKRNVLIRKLPAVEALGSTNVICTDKTGTITKNVMSITSFVTSQFQIDQLDPVKQKKDLDNPELNLLATAAMLCNDATDKTGDPTEKALVWFAQELGLKPELRKQYPRLDEIPFNSDDKYMITLNQLDGGKLRAFLKGAPEKVIQMCSSIQVANKTKKFTSTDQQEIEAKLKHMSSKGLRVLALGYRDMTKPTSFKKIDDYVFIGLVGMIDPPRPDVKKALAACKKAGIRVVMITGDHPLTAKNIAEEVGFEVDQVVTGSEIEQMDRHQLEKIVESTSVFARVSPVHKLQVLRALQNLGYFVAMTGDGVNDAPALKEAHIGIAVGSGTDISKEVSDMIILDDNFATITLAIMEGRGIFSNIKKFVKFLLAANFDEILVILASIILGTPLPMLPIHLLWINMVTDSAPALALSVDNYEPELMNQPPIKPEKEILQGLASFSLVAGLLAFIVSFGAFLQYYYGMRESLATSQTITFTVTVFFELFLVFAVRSKISAFKVGIFSNKWLLAAVSLAVILQLGVIYFPYTQELFKTVSLPLSAWPTIITMSASGFLIIEIIRAFKYQHLPILFREKLAQAKQKN